MATEDKSPERLAADNLYSLLGEHAEDVLDEACSETWTGGEAEWWSQDGHPEDLERHRETTFRVILGELASLCLERSLGRYEGRASELRGEQS